MAARKPNILIVMVDQLAAQFLPAYGHKIVKAPNLDRLAAEGVVFDDSGRVRLDEFQWRPRIRAASKKK